MRCTDEMVAAVDAARGLIPREAWLRRAVERALSDHAQRDDHLRPVASGPAEQPDPEDVMRAAAAKQAAILQKATRRRERTFNPQPKSTKG